MTPNNSRRIEVIDVYECDSTDPRYRISRVLERVPVPDRVTSGGPDGLDEPSLRPRNLPKFPKPRELVLDEEHSEASYGSHDASFLFHLIKPSLILPVALVASLASLEKVSLP